MSRDLTNLYIDETFQYLLQVSGSEVENGVGLRQDFLDVSSSHALNADNSISSSYALTASYALNSVPQVSASYATSASHALNADNSISSSYSVTALSSSFSNTSISSSHSLTADTSISSSYATNALSASYALISTNAVSASIADTATTAVLATAAISSSYALTASYALNAGTGDSFPYTGSAVISGSLDVIGPLTVNSPDDNISFQGPDLVTMNISQFGINSQKFGSGSVNIGFNSFGGNSQPNIFFTGVNSYFQANNNMFFENAPGGVGSGNMGFISNGNLEFRTPAGDVDGGFINFVANSGSISLQTGADIDINGKAFAYSISSNVNGFSIQVNERTVVRDNQRAFVETPLILGTNGTIEVGVGSTLKVINEL